MNVNSIPNKSDNLQINQQQQEQFGFIQNHTNHCEKPKQIINFEIQKGLQPSDTFQPKQGEIFENKYIEEDGEDEIDILEKMQNEILIQGNFIQKNIKKNKKFEKKIKPVPQAYFGQEKQLQDLGAQNIYKFVDIIQMTNINCNMFKMVQINTTMNQQQQDQNLQQYAVKIFTEQSQQQFTAEIKMQNYINNFKNALGSSCNLAEGFMIIDETNSKFPIFDSKNLNCPALVFPFVQYTLFSILKQRLQLNKPWSEDELFHYFKQLSAIFYYLSLINVAHGDIKPENFLLDIEQSQLILCDFGISHILESQYSLMFDVGTQNYSSPEKLYSTQKIDILKSEIFSLGMVFLCLIDIRTFSELDRQNLENIKLEIINNVRSQIVKQIIQQTLEEQPEDRISFQELYHKLKNIQSHFPNEKQFFVQKDDNCRDDNENKYHNYLKNLQNEIEKLEKIQGVIQDGQGIENIEMEYEISLEERESNTDLIQEEMSKICFNTEYQIYNLNNDDNYNNIIDDEEYQLATDIQVGHIDPEL